MRVLCLCVCVCEQTYKKTSKRYNGMKMWLALMVIPLDWSVSVVCCVKMSLSCSSRMVNKMMKTSKGRKHIHHTRPYKNQSKMANEPTVRWPNWKKKKETNTVKQERKRAAKISKNNTTTHLATLLSLYKCTLWLLLWIYFLLLLLAVLLTQYVLCTIRRCASATKIGMSMSHQLALTMPDVLVTCNTMSNK